MVTNAPVFGWRVASADGSDLIANVGSIINQFARDVVDSFHVPTDSKKASARWDTYPLGISLMALTTNGANDGNWPGGTGQVLTLRRGTTGDIAHQLKFDGFVSGAAVVRVRVGSTNGWSSWVVIGWDGQPVAEATGQITGTPPSGGGVIALPVTFPSNRFTGTPRVMVALNATTLPNECACSVSNLSSTGCTVYLYRQNNVATSVAWHAIQGVEV